MRRTSTLFAFALCACGLVACSSDAPPGGTTSGSSSGTINGNAPAMESAKRGTVKISKGGSAVVEYTSTGVDGNIDGDQIYFELNSPDTKQVLHLTIHARAAGDYELAEKGTAGKAHVLFFTEDKLPSASSDSPAEWSPTAGTLTLEKATSTHAKGSFKGAGTPKDDAVEYAIEGTFDVPLRMAE